jgi:ADP-heptose:LPS heptosyltransferase
LERYAALAERVFAEWKIPTLFTGTATQREFIASVAGRSGVINAAGKFGLGGLFGVLKSARFFLGGDSGAAHAAAALGVPTLAIFGITESARTRPLGEKVCVIGAGGEHAPNWRSPETQRASRAALAEISVEKVFAIAERLAQS